VLDAFATEGLLTLAADTVEISHEVLLTCTARILNYVPDLRFRGQA